MYNEKNTTDSFEDEVNNYEEVESDVSSAFDDPVAIYLKETKRFPLLTHEATMELFRKYKEEQKAELQAQRDEIAREKGMKKVLLNINENNVASIKVCEKAGGKLQDTININGEKNRRYWIEL